jgi:hypothetical protein
MMRPSPNLERKERPHLFPVEATGRPTMRRSPNLGQQERLPPPFPVETTGRPTVHPTQNLGQQECLPLHFPVEEVRPPIPVSRRLRVVQGDLRGRVAETRGEALQETRTRRGRRRAEVAMTAGPGTDNCFEWDIR